MFALSTRILASSASAAGWNRSAYRGINTILTSSSSTGARLYSSLPPKSAPATAPNVSSTPSTEEALAQNAQTSADELEPISADVRAQLNALAKENETDTNAESRPTVEEVKHEHQPIDTAKAAPDLARKTGQA
ncbi:hypothetical protein CF335_g6002 [Tilletia laevis]|nr:hypothetical protein CF335_g6002 [Tilletia laevis]